MQPDAAMRNDRAMKTLCLILVACAMTGGCTPKGGPQAAAGKPKPPSTAETLVNGATGYTAVKAGQKAKADITRISENHNRDLDNVMK